MTSTSPFGTLFSGMSGLALPIPKYKYPVEFQDSSRLTYYSSLFNSIEINQSFYRLPKAKTIARWAAEVPADFKFTFKLWKQITHAKGLRFNESDVKEFMDTIGHAGNKRGCLLIQFPASLKSHSIDQLGLLLHAVQTNNTDNSWKVAIEFRDSSWYNDDTYELVDVSDATIVIHDKRGATPPPVELRSEAKYLRFHGPRGDYRASYDEAFLQEYATYIHQWREAGKSVFVYFNNTNGDAYNNLRQLMQECRGIV